jgi:inner membrane protein
MDVITHAVLGAALACATAPRHARLPARRRLLLGAAAAAFPDLDFVAFPIDPLRFLADWHQGPTHSLVLLPLWALLLGGLFGGWRGRRGAFREAVAISGLGVASHIAADVVTAYGTAVLYPLSGLRVSLATTFVIDPVFSAIVLAALAAGVWTRSRSAAGLGLVVLCLYVAGQGWLQQRALEAGRAAARDHSGNAALAQLAALPQPFSPFNWKLIGSAGDRYFVAHVNLAGHRPAVPDLPGLQRWHALAAAYRPPAELSWRVHPRYGGRPELRAQIERLWADPRFAPYRRFATHPAVSRIDSGASETCVWFTDLRYDLPALPDTFRYGFCHDNADVAWRLYRLRYFSERERQPLVPRQ